MLLHNKGWRAADPRLLADYDTGKPGWKIAPGAYEIAIGTDAGTTITSGSARLIAQILRP